MQQAPSPCKTRARTGLRTRKFAVRLGLVLAVLALLCLVALIVFGDFFLNRFAKPRVEHRFDAAHPGLSLSLGQLHYDFHSNQIACTAVALRNLKSGTCCNFQNVMARGVDWRRLLFEPRRLPLILARGHLEASGMTLTFPISQYEIHCARLSLSVRDSEAVLEDFELRPSLGDEQFFAARGFRRTRFSFRARHCRFVGLAALDLLQGQTCRARVIEMQNSVLETVFNRDKPVNLNARRRLTLHDLLAAFKIPLQFEQVKITNSLVKFGERTVPGEAARFLTFDATSLTAQGLIYPAEAGICSPMYATAKFMNAGELSLTAQVPLAEPQFTFSYSGSLGAMNLSLLNPFLEVAGHCRVKSGRLQELTFSAAARNGDAQGQLRALYENVDLELLPPNGPAPQRILAGTKSFLMDELLLRRTNLPETGKSVAVGRIEYTRKPGESFLHFGWFALRSGMIDVLGLTRYVKN